MNRLLDSSCRKVDQGATRHRVVSEVVRRGSACSMPRPNILAKTRMSQRKNLKQPARAREYTPGLRASREGYMHRRRRLASRARGAKLHPRAPLN